MLYCRLEACRGGRSGRSSADVRRRPLRGPAPAYPAAVRPPPAAVNGTLPGTSPGGCTDRLLPRILWDSHHSKKRYDPGDTMGFAGKDRASEPATRTSTKAV